MKMKKKSEKDMPQAAPATQPQAETGTRKPGQSRRAKKTPAGQKASAFLPKADSEQPIGEGERADSVVNSPDLPARDAAASGQNGTPGAGPSHQDIAARAYELYVERGRESGHAHEDWLRAERELRKQ
jgi:hypothetical protein